MTVHIGLPYNLTSECTEAFVDMKRSVGGEESVIKVLILLLIVVSVGPVHVSAQSGSKGDKESDLAHNDIVITGCLTKNSHKEFELVDQEGFENLPYSPSVHLDEYVGKTVTLVGRRAATPSYETHANLKTHFLGQKSAGGIGAMQQVVRQSNC